MKTYIFYFLIFALLFSCDEEEHISAVFINTGFGIVVKDEQGTDLLNPANENSYKADSIDIYWMINDIKTRKLEANLDNPEPFKIHFDPYKEIYFMTLILNHNIDENNKAITYVKWNSKEEDKFECEFKLVENTYFKYKLWFNNSLIWDWDNYDYHYEIIK